MIKICLLKKQMVIGFQAYDHSGYAPRGEDIVCAAVSALTQTAVMGLEQVAKAKVEYRMGEGSLFCKAEGVQENSKAQAILETMALGLREIEEQYPDYVKISEQEV